MPWPGLHHTVQTRRGQAAPPTFLGHEGSLPGRAVHMHTRTSVWKPATQLRVRVVSYQNRSREGSYGPLQTPSVVTLPSPSPRGAARRQEWVPRVSEPQKAGRTWSARSRVLIPVLCQAFCVAPDAPPSQSVFPTVKQRILDEPTPRGYPGSRSSCCRSTAISEDGRAWESGAEGPGTPREPPPGQEEAGEGDAVGARNLSQERQKPRATRWEQQGGPTLDIRGANDKP